MKNAENVPGRYYVDSSCIDCDMCRDLAPDIFARHENGAYSYIQRQPATAEEVKMVDEAIACCATESIGDNGE
ncbi:MAG TPA: ferredoxin [Verrucomicrobiae bacterium]